MEQERSRTQNSTVAANRGDDGGNGTVSELLGHGQENALTKREIMQRANIRTDREFYSIIHDERVAGTPILCSGKGGYFLPSREHEQARREMLTFRDRQTKMAKSIFMSIRCVTKALREMFGQQTIDGTQKDGQEQE